MQDLQISQLLARMTAASASTGSASSDFSSCLQQSTMKSPASMDEIFERAAQTYGVPLNLLKAVAKAESNFQADVVSGCGAIGVMQLMPGTARALGVTDPYDAEQNIMGGAKYLADMLSRYDGDASLALAAYNAGPGNVNKYGGVPPFPETQNYVQKVLAYAGKDLGEIGAVPTKGKASYTHTGQQPEEISSMGELLAKLLNSKETTTPQEAAQLYSVFRTLMQSQFNSSFARSSFYLDDDDNMSSNSLSQQMRYLSL